MKRTLISDESKIEKPEKSEKPKRGRKKKEPETLPVPVQKNVKNLLASVAPKDEEETGLVKLEEQAQKNPFLPYAYLTNPRTQDLDAWGLALVDGKTTIVQAPYLLSHVLTRHMVRRLEGGQYTDRAYSPVNAGKGETSNSFQEVYKDLEAGNQKVLDAGWERGFVHLIVLITNEGATFLTIESFKTLENYWTEALIQGNLNNDMAVKIKITSHEKNVKKSAATGYEYLASWKFKQWESVKLSPQILEAIDAAYQEQSEQIQRFLDR